MHTGRLTLFLLLFCFIVPSFVEASSVILDDDFYQSDKVSQLFTTAKVDNTKGEVRLPQQPMPNSLALNDYFGSGYAVVTQEGVKFYGINENESSLMEITNIPVDTPLGVALSSHQKTAFILVDGQIKRFDFAGNGFEENPAQVIGVNNVISIASFDELNGVASLNSEGQIEIYSSDLNNPVVFQTGIKDPVSLSVVPNTTDLVVAAKDSVFYIPSTDNGYRPPIELVTGINGFVSADTDLNGNILSVRFESGYGEINQFLKVQNYNHLVQSTVFSPVDQPVSISMKGISEFGYITKQGDVRYFASNGEMMMEIPGMNLDGLDLTVWYQTPRDYQSISVPADPFDLIKISPQSYTEDGQDISYQVSSDGGSTFYSITPNQWMDIPLGTEMVVKATLSTTNHKTTPILSRIVVETSKFDIQDLTVTKQFFPGGNQVDSPPTQNFPVYEMAGGQVEFTVKTSGGVQEVKALFSDGTSLDLVPLNALDEADNVFYGWYAVPLELEDGDSINVELIAKRVVKEKTLTQTPFIVVDGNVKSLLDIRLVE
ncbi:MAG: hypothetical protein H0Z33_11235 [Bacillaceae bacterium]|nr:hypothetical protein [Bacillaceae bacterium]